MVKGQRATGFTNTEEEAVRLTAVVPFLVEDVLKNGATFTRAADWQPHVVRRPADHGPEPGFVRPAARPLLELLKA